MPQTAQKLWAHRFRTFASAAPAKGGEMPSPWEPPQPSWAAAALWSSAAIQRPETRDHLYVLSTVINPKINLSISWLCKPHIKQKPMSHWLSKPAGTNKLQISLVAQDDLVKHCCCSELPREEGEQCSELHTALCLEKLQRSPPATEIFI